MQALKTEKPLKKFRIVGWVEVYVQATIEASSLKAAKAQVTRIENKYGKGNGTSFNYEDGDWVSPVTIEKIEEVE